jgi:hypothetical protein
MRGTARVWRTVAAGVLVAAGLCAPRGGHAAAATGTLLRYHFAVGQHYSLLEVDTTKDVTKSVDTTKKTKSIKKENEVDRFAFTTTVVAVHPDGSADLRTTYSSGSVTKNGKTTTVPVQGFSRLVRVSTVGKPLSSKTIGAATIPASLKDAIPDTGLLPFPAAPVHVGQIWPLDANSLTGAGGQSGSSGSSSKSSSSLQLPATCKLLALTTLQGRPTATMHIAFGVPASKANAGMALNGTVDAQIYTDDGEFVAPAHGAFHFAFTFAFGPQSQSNTTDVSLSLAPQP